MLICLIQRRRWIWKPIGLSKNSLWWCTLTTWRSSRSWLIPRMITCSFLMALQREGSVFFQSLYRYSNFFLIIKSWNEQLPNILSIITNSLKVLHAAAEFRTYDVLIPSPPFSSVTTWHGITLFIHSKK